MPQAPPNNANLLPRWLVVAGSLAILFHLGNVVVAALNAPSGPWPTPFGSSTATPPPFASSVAESVTQYYGNVLRVTDSYRFASNRPVTPDVAFEVHLKDEEGRVIEKLTFPDSSANCWVRHRQQLLAQALAPDIPVEPPQGEVIPAPGRPVTRVPIWDQDGPRQLKFAEVPQHLVPRNRPVSRPPDWGVVLARSYARYLCRTHGAASADILRRTREPIFPVVLFASDPPPAEAFEDLIATFGDLPR